MPTNRGVYRCNPPASAREPLPMDIQIEIVARCDVTTIVRCAAATKLLRRAILDPSFRRRLAIKAAAGGGGFDPALLFGVSYLTYDARLAPSHHVVGTPSAIQLHARLQASSLRGSFEPVASRGRLLLLRRYGSVLPQPPNVELRVCDTTTGLVTALPNVFTFYAHAFLSVSVSVSDAVAGGSYELIVMDRRFRFQTFSSKHGQWGAAREASGTGDPYCLDPSSRVIGRTVYWLCHRNARPDCWDGILALDVDAAEATTMELPPGCSSRMMAAKKEKHLLLASVRGRLSLLVAETSGIAMWTLTPAATWSRQLVIGAKEITRPVGLVSSSPLSFILEGFGERSGAVILRVDTRELLRLDLGTKVVSRLHNNAGDASVASLFLHETDLASLIKKSF